MRRAITKMMYDLLLYAKESYTKLTEKETKYIEFMLIAHRDFEIMYNTKEDSDEKESIKEKSNGNENI